MQRGYGLIIGLSITGSLLWSLPASAYLDPGTGSFILQAILGGIAGALVAGRLYWHRLKAFFGLERGANEGRETNEGD